MREYNFEEAVKVIEEHGYKVVQERLDKITFKTKFECINSDGYYVYVNLDKLLFREGNRFLPFSASNKRSIDNINIFAEKNGIKTRCIDDKYISSTHKLKFKCECGNIFKLDSSHFMYGKKTRCNECVQCRKYAKYEDIKNHLHSNGYYLISQESEFINAYESELICQDIEGYLYNFNYINYIDTKFQILDKFSPTNKFTIKNINLFLKSQNIPFVCISDIYINQHTLLQFRCERCGEIINKTWFTVNSYCFRDGKNIRGLINCPNCDNRTESVHALVLKQMFLHYYPDTIVEERSCVNPNTNKVMPTDIVNHRLKIAIEIQSQWHEKPKMVIKDAIKKEFWLNKGYSFYAPDIRDYTILEICQLFFDIDKLPDYIDYTYSNKINYKLVQKYLNDGYKPFEIAKILNIKRSKIMDALRLNIVYYADGKFNHCYTPVIQLDMWGNYIDEFESMIDAERKTGISAQRISSATRQESHYTKGYLWYNKIEYDSIDKNNIKPWKYAVFFKSVDKYDLNGNLIQKFETLIDAAKELGVINYDIFQVTENKKKSIKGFIYKYSDEDIIVENA